MRRRAHLAVEGIHVGQPGTQHRRNRCFASWRQRQGRAFRGVQEHDRQVSRNAVAPQVLLAITVGGQIRRADERRVGAEHARRQSIEQDRVIVGQPEVLQRELAGVEFAVEDVPWVEHTSPDEVVHDSHRIIDRTCARSAPTARSRPSSRTRS